MFSRIFKSARALIRDDSKDESSQDDPSQSSQPNTQSSTMVTPRRQTRSKSQHNDDLNDDNTINVYVSSGSKRRTRSSRDEEPVEENEDGSTPSAKRRKKLPLREKAEVNPKKTIPVVEIRARKVSPQVVEEENSHDHPIEIEDDEESSEEDEDEDEEGEEEKDEAETGDTVQAGTKKKHMRFGSEEPEQEIFSTAREATDEVKEIANSSDEEDEDSEDDAPEAVGIQQAAEEIKSRERDAARAVQEQQLASRKKRKERDGVLKKQSDGKKRKLVADTVPTPGEEAASPAPSPIPSSHLTNHPTLPNFLPAEYLSDTESPAVISTPEPATLIKKSKKTKFQDAESMVPKDRRIGKTTYRVAKTERKELAPKSAFQARSVKEAWLQGRSGGKVDPRRRAFGKAFGRA